jgi:CRP-like cAMP-binding protein
MSNDNDLKRKFVIATGDEGLRSSLTEALLKLFNHATVVAAKDGAEATFKIENDKPHVVLIDPNLAKLSGHKLIEWLVVDKEADKIAGILLTAIPEREQFVDAVALGQVQYLPQPVDEKQLSIFVSRALNFASAQKQAALKMKNLKAGDLLMNEGDKAEHVYILRVGQLEAFTKKSGTELTLGKIDPGEFVGEMAYINGEPRIASVRALVDCELVEIPINLLDHVLFMKPAWAKALMKTLSKRIKSANQSR